MIILEIYFNIDRYNLHKYITHINITHKLLESLIVLKRPESMRTDDLSKSFEFFILVCNLVGF